MSDYNASMYKGELRIFIFGEGIARSAKNKVASHQKSILFPLNPLPPDDKKIKKFGKGKTILEKLRKIGK